MGPKGEFVDVRNERKSSDGVQLLTSNSVTVVTNFFDDRLLDELFVGLHFLYIFN